MTTAPILAVQDLRTWFHTDAGIVKAVDGVSFDIAPGEVFAIVGESGSGKSVTAMSILGLLPQPPAKIESGKVEWKGVDLVTADEDTMRTVRGSEISIVFQDPMTSLNPVLTVGQQVAEVVRVHEKVSKADAWERAVDALELVGLPAPKERARQYPHELSGGMRQRAMIAMAIVCQPDLLIADEPTTALDVTVQAQVLDVIHRIRSRTKLAVLLITHDLGVVAGMADRVMVMYAGRAMETGTADEIFYRTRHPYTLGLLASLPRLDAAGGQERLVPIPGHPPSLLHLPPGCPFHPRCTFSRLPEPCATEVPPLRGVDDDWHRSACHFAEDLRTTSAATLKASS